MEPLTTQMFDLLTAPPGNLVFHMVLAVMLAACLQAVLSNNSPSKSSLRKRMILGFTLLLALQGLLFLASGLAWQGFIDAHIFLPPLDRWIAALTTIILVWLICFPDRIAWVNALCMLIASLCLVFLIANLVMWPTWSATLAFNNSWFDVTWQIADIVFALVGIMIVCLRQPSHWGFGLGIFILIFCGSLLQVLAPQNSNDFAGAARLGFLTAFPLLLSLPHRLDTYAQTPASADLSASLLEPLPRTRFGANSEAAQSLFELAAEVRGDLKTSTIARALGLVMNADCCYLIPTPLPKQQVILKPGYDIKHNLVLNEVSLDARKIPTLVSALQKGLPLQLAIEDGGPAEIQKLAAALHLPNSGHLLLYPLAQPGQAPWGGVLLLSPFSRRVWITDDQTYLEPIARTLATLLVLTPEPSSSGEAIQLAQRETQAAWFPEEKGAPDGQDFLPVNPQDESNKNMAAILAVQEENQATITRLQAENERLTNTLAAAQTPGPEPMLDDHLRSELAKATAEIGQLQNALIRANTELDANRTSAAPSNKLARLAEQLHQTVTAITGYTDVLLGESLGSPNPLQRKFLERIRGSAEKISDLVTDLALGFTPDEGDGQSPAAISAQLGRLADEFPDTSTERILRPIPAASTTEAPQNQPEINPEVPANTGPESQTGFASPGVAKSSEQGTASAKPDTSASSAWIEDATTFIRSRLDDQGVTMRVDLPAELPHFTGDTAQIRDAISLALALGIDHSSQAGELKLSAEPSGSNQQGATFLIETDGKTMPKPANLLSQVPSWLDYEDQSSLEGDIDLSQAQEAASRLGGKLWVETQADGHYLVHLYLPSE